MDKNPLIGKCLAVGIIILFAGAGIIPTTAQNGEKPSLPTSSGHWLYVGGDGPGNYTKIQNAINASTSGDTIFVYSGTYYENLVINVSIQLIGEDKNTTLIDGKYIDNVIRINKNNIWIEGFSIIKSSNKTWQDSGINLSSSNNTIANCNFYDNYLGIFNQYYANNNTVKNNYFHENYCGMIIRGESGGIRFINNIETSYVDCGLAASGTKNVISGNIFLNHKEYGSSGLRLIWTDYNDVTYNLFANNFFGITCENAWANQIVKNNFIDNKNHTGMFLDGVHLPVIRNRWINNYWSGSPLSGLFPKTLLGHAYLLPLGIVYPYIEVDWHPAKKPYDIPRDDLKNV